MPDTDPQSRSVAAVVLAAGGSTRMGGNKLLLQLEGASLIRRAVSGALDAGLAPVVVVLGPDADQARGELAGLPVLIEVSAGDAGGMGESLRTGVAALPTTAPAVVVLLADMPLVTSAMLRTLVIRYREDRAPIVLSDYEGVTAPPVLYDRSLFPELASLRGEGVGREVIRRHRGEAAAVHWSRAALEDLDLPEDYERLRGRGQEG